LTENQFVAINSRSVVHENLEGEVILIHLETGIYYSFNGVGADIWAMIGNGLSIQQIVNKLLSRYHQTTEKIEPSVEQFVQELQNELLVVLAPVQQPGNSGSINDSGNDSKLPFQAPRLEKFTDMQEFLMVDPIHEVSDDGWPHKLSE
jgi:hypothetical protein